MKLNTYDTGGNCRAYGESVMRCDLVKPSITMDALNVEELLHASRKCKRGVAWKSSTQTYYMKRLVWIANTKSKLEIGSYKPKKNYEFTIHERGKLRLIKANHISDRVVQKAFNDNVLKKKIYPKLIYDNSASQVGKGTDFCLDRVRCHLQRHYRKYDNRGYVLLIDFTNYFGNVDKKILIDKLSKVLDEDEVTLCKAFLKADNTDIGIGLGSEVNQTFAIFYASDLDHFIKEKLKIKGYCRYMDDLILMHHDRDYLKYCLEEILKFCSKENIIINRRKCKICNLKNDWFEYLKKKMKLTSTGRVLMKPIKANISRRKQRLKRQKELLDNGKIDIKGIVESYNCWRGYACKYDISPNTLKGVDNLFIELFGVETFSLIRRRKYDKRRNLKRT